MHIIDSDGAVTVAYHHQTVIRANIPLPTGLAECTIIIDHESLRGLYCFCRNSIFCIFFSSRPVCSRFQPNYWTDFHSDCRYQFLGTMRIADTTKFRPWPLTLTLTLAKYPKHILGHISKTTARIAFRLWHKVASIEAYKKGRQRLDALRSTKTWFLRRFLRPTVTQNTNCQKLLSDRQHVSFIRTTYPWAQNSSVTPKLCEQAMGTLWPENHTFNHILIHVSIHIFKSYSSIVKM